MTHDAHHERILDGVLVGDLPADAPEVAALRDGCTACRDRLSGDAALERALGGAEDEIAELLSEAARGPVAGEEEALAGFRAAAGIAPLSTGRRALLALAAALAAVVLVYAYLRGGSEPARDDRGPMLTPGAVECIAPVGVADADADFAWRARAGPGARYTLRVFDADERLLFRVEGLREPSYAPSEAERVLLDGDVRWEVIAFDSTDVVLGADDAFARF